MPRKSQEIDVRFECIQCGACCSEKDMIVTLTGRDIARLARGLGLSAKQMLKVIDFYLPSKSREMPEGLRLMTPAATERGPAIIALKKTSSGECIFLEDNLCMIHVIRPGACRAFPFFFSDDDGLKWGLNARKAICPGLGEGSKVDLDDLLVLAQEILEDIAIFEEFLTFWNANQDSPQSTRLIELIVSDIRFNA